MAKMNRLFRDILQRTCGAAIVEFAFALPVLILTSLGIYEVTTLIRVNAKLNEMSSNLAHWVAAKPSLATVNDVLFGTGLIGYEFDFYNKGKARITGISQVGTSTSQKSSWSYGTTGSTTTITVNGSSVVTGAGFSLVPSSNVIVVEVTYNYQPMFTYFTGILPSVTLYRVSQFVPESVIDPLPVL